jgi:hypothetical protein
MIYNADVPIPEELVAIDKLVVATPIHIHDVYGARDNCAGLLYQACSVERA